MCLKLLELSWLCSFSMEYGRTVNQGKMDYKYRKGILEAEFFIYINLEEMNFITSIKKERNC